MDAGFSLLEVIVALGVLSTVVVALLPQLMVGIRSAGTAKAVTEAKGVAQGELERMRNLPFHVAPAAGEYIDVLDRYYRDLAAPASAGGCTAGGAYAIPQTTWSGYVGPGSSARCDYEPGTGAFYRRVQIVPSPSMNRDFVVVTSTQFLSGATPPSPVTPRTGYSTQVSGRDNPPSAQIGVTVTVFHTDHGKPRAVSSYTQISEHLPSPQRVRGDVGATAVSLGSVTPDGLPLTLTAGLVNATGAVSGASTVSANVAATSAGLATGEQATGAARSSTAPPAGTVPVLTSLAGSLGTAGCSYACWGPTTVGPATISADEGLPNAGTAMAPLQAMVGDTTANDGLSFGNSTSSAAYRSELELAAPLVRLDTSAPPYPGQMVGCAVVGTGSVGASGFVRTTGEDDLADPSSVESCAVARSTAVSLFPTSFAPKGVVRITLTRASAQCRVSSSSHTPTATSDYAATVEYWDGTQYRTAATVTPGQTVDPLDAVPLTTPVGDNRTLGHYVAFWSTVTSDKVSSTEVAGLAEVAVPGVVTIASQPVRSDATSPDGLDATSTVSLTLGAVSCSAEDAR